MDATQANQENEAGSTLLVMDGTAMVFRSFYGMDSIRSAHGVEIGAVFGVAQQLQDLLARHRPAHAVVVFDTDRNTFRKELDPQYKANRKPIPPALPHQIDMLRQLVDALGIQTYAVAGYEADDLMATLSAQARQIGMATQLVSIDKDLCQLVCDRSPSIRLYDPYRVIYYDESGVRERLGIPPRLAIDYQALVGDSTDNIPGVPGIGPKTALGLLHHIGDLDTIYDQLDQVHTTPVRGAKKLRSLLHTGKSKAYLSKQLVTLRQDVPLPHNPQSLPEITRWTGPRQDAEATLQDLGFSLSLEWFARIAQARPTPYNEPTNPQASRD